MSDARRTPRGEFLLLLAMLAVGCLLQPCSMWGSRASARSVAAMTTLPRVLVTGGNKGIGRALCKQLAADHGFHVFLGSRDKARGEAAVASIIKEAPQCDGRLQLLVLDAASDDSVAAAAQEVAALKSNGADTPLLHAIVNNAGVGFGLSLEATLAVNLYGPKRVCDAFIPLLCPKNGRVVNTASASGPMFVAACQGVQRDVLVNPAVTWEEIEALVQQALASPRTADPPYGFSKACLNAYTLFLARTHTNLRINSVTPGFIDTDITRGMGATKPPEEGTKAAIYCLTAELEGNGRYYGSDAVRSPLDRYRGPGDPPYVGP